MSSVVSGTSLIENERSPSKAAARRAQALAERLERGAGALAAFAGGLTDEEWRMRVPSDGRTIGVIVHHVASVYPVEIQLAQKLAAGQPIEGVTMDDIHAMNAAHAREHECATREEALNLLRRNSAAAADAIRAFTDDELDRAGLASLYSQAPVTCQFVLEDHPVRHSYHHLARMRAVLKR